MIRKKLWMFMGLCLLCFFGSLSTQAQLEVQGGFTPDELAQLLVGSGVVVFDATLQCGEQGAGVFDGEFTNVGMDGGIILTSGTIQNAEGPNNTGGISTIANTPGDIDLEIATGFPTNDACIFEFDFVPFGDSIRFNYVFGSDEYLEFAFSAFNDAFGFFLSGPGISGGGLYTNDAINIALVPGTNQAVAIDNINDQVNSQYFVCNGDPNNNCQPFSPVDINSTVQYDGLTTVLQAIAAVTPCDTYHLKMAVADAGDSSLDSGVFLESGSLSVDIVTIAATTTLTTIDGFNNAVEGCVDGIVTFTREFPTSTPTDIIYEIGGTADNGIDYDFLPGVATIPPFATEVEVLIDFIDDGMPDSPASAPETFTLTVTTDFGCDEELIQTATIEVIDAEELIITQEEFDISPGDTIMLEATGGGFNYFWTPLSQIFNSNTPTPTVYPTDTTVYTVTTALGDCIYQKTVTVNVIPPPVDSCVLNAFFMTAGLCADADPVQLVPVMEGGTWSGAGVNANGLFTPTVSGEFPITYTVIDETLDDCTESFTDTVTVFAVPNASFTTQTFCSNDAPTALAVTQTGGTWSGMGIDPATGIFTPGPTGSFEITYTITTDNGCSDSQTNFVNVIAQADASFTTMDFCQGDAPFQFTADGTSGGVWSGTGITASGVFDPMNGSGAYTITYTAGSSSCQDVVSQTVTINPLPNSTFTFGTYEAGGSPATLTPATAGGTWSGTGVDDDGVFTPGDAGTYPITYSVTSPQGCSSTTTFNVIVVNVGDPCFPPQAFCATSGPVALTSNEPGGTWSGPGVSFDGIFNPAIGAGVYAITHTIGSGVGTQSCTENVTVYAEPNANFIPEDFCENGPASAIAAIQVGGTWSGTGITPGGVFDPMNLTPGDYAVTYSITTGDGCSASLTQDITIFPEPNSSFTEVSFCEGGAPTMLSAVTPGGTWDGIGVSSTGLFDPGVGIGSYVIGYTVIGQGGCAHTSTRVISVLEGGDASFTVSNVCVGGNPVQFVATTPGGTWDGPGITQSGLFNPAGLTAGSYSISYSVGADGCASTVTNQVTVLPLANSTFTSASVCTNGAPIQLSAVTAGGTWSGPGVSASGVFNPAGLAVGSYTITHTATAAGGCTSSSTGSVTIIGLPNASFNSVSVCEGGNSVQLTAVTGGGTFSGTGVSGGLFNPAGLNPGSYTINYTVTNAQGCTNSSTGTVTIGTQPVTTFPDVYLCIEDGPTQLSANETGGVWSGIGVSASGIFNPTNLTAGVYEVTYTTTTDLGCSSVSTGQVAISQQPDSDFTSINICQNDGIVQLSAAVAGGVWSGTGVSADGMFNPTGLAGIYEITYTVSNLLNCSNTSTGTVTVSALPNSSVDDAFICENGAPVQLTATTLGGVFSGSGISANGVFDPSGAPVGSYTVTYTVTNIAGCMSASTATITVGSAPNATFPDAAVCQDGSVTLVASIGGGTWSGTGVAADGTFDATGLAAGTYTVTYTIGTSNGCSSTSTGSVTVSSAPDASFNGAAICANETVTLSAATAGGTWSGMGISADGVFDATGLDAGLYEIVYTVTTGDNCTATSVGSVTVSAPVTVTVDLAPSCIGFTGNYEMILTPAGGDGGPYSLSGGFTGATDGSITVSGAGDGSTFDYVVTDAASGCSTTISFTAPSCGICNPIAGTVTDLFVCGGETASITSEGADASSVDTLVYVLHSAAVFSETDILSVSGNGNFDLADFGGSTNTDYYVSAVATNMDNGAIMFAGECTDISNSAQVVFLDPISLNYDVTCDGDEGLFTLVINLSGGMPEYDPMTTYDVSGDLNVSGAVLGDMFILDYVDTDAINITVTDANTCVTSLITGPISCAKCGTQAGVIPTNPQSACGSETVQAQATGFTLFGSTLTYIVHTDTSEATFPGEIVGAAPQSSNGAFTFADLFDNAESNTTYFISAVLAQTDANGLPIIEEFDFCLVVMTGPAVTFSDGVGFDIVVDVVCAEDDASYQAIVAIGGDATETYTIDINGVTGTTTGEMAYISQDINNGDGYIVTASNSSGCTSILSNPQVFCDAATSIELLSFDGEMKKEGNQLTWKLASESDIKTYVVERSIDGRDFAAVGEITSLGDINTNRQYDFFDAYVETGVVFYRLRVVETNGTTTTTNTIELYRVATEMEIIRLQPVPTFDQLLIVLQSAQEEPLTITIYDIAGKIVLSQDVEIVEGENQLNVDVSSFAAGLYTLQLQSADAVVVERMIKE